MKVGQWFVTATQADTHSRTCQKKVDIVDVRGIQGGSINLVIKNQHTCSSLPKDVCVHGCASKKIKKGFTFWSEPGFTGLWVDRSMLGGRQTLSIARHSSGKATAISLSQACPLIIQQRFTVWREAIFINWYLNCIHWSQICSNHRDG